jgi:hypothetical protein
MIRKLRSGQYRLYSRNIDPRTGRRRNLGTFKSRAAAEKHERAVQHFKRDQPAGVRYLKVPSGAVYSRWRQSAVDRSETVSHKEWLSGIQSQKGQSARPDIPTCSCGKRRSFFPDRISTACRA